MKRLRKSILNLDQLEARETPATFVNATTITYQDVDGDNVTVKLSKPILTAAIAAQVFGFNNPFATAGPQQLRSINFGALDEGVPGLGVATTAVRSAANGGDGFAAVGQIETLSGNTFLKFDLGAVVIDGDLGRIDAGDTTTATPGLASLTVQSMGRFGTSTGAASLISVIQGKLGALTVKGDVKDAFIDVQGGVDGKIGSINIGGSLIGGAGSNSGSVHAAGDIGAMSIKGNVTGGDGIGAGSIETAGGIASVSIGGDVRGGADKKSGLIFSTEAMGAVRIGGSLIGGGEQDAGKVRTFSSLASVTIGGDLRGGTIIGTGRVESSGAMGPVKIAGNVIGAAGGSGTIESSSTLASVTIGGDLLGGSGPSSGKISSINALGSVKITGNVIGGAGSDSGVIFTNSTLASVTIGGNLLGGDGQLSGRIESVSAMGPIKVAVNVIGGNGSDSGWIFTDSSMASVRIGGNLEGGSGNKSGQIDAGGAIGSIKITRNLIGGSRDVAVDLEKSGYIQGQRIGSLTIGGSLIAGNKGPAVNFFHNGAIRVQDDIGNLTIGNIIGNAGNHVIISARGSAAPTATTDVAIGKLTVKGRVEFARILGGFDLNGVANADAQIGTINVSGDWIASSIAAGAIAGNGLFGDSGDAKMTGGGVKDVATVSSSIKSLTIGGQALGTVGGGDHFGIVAENVGVVTVGGTLLPTSAATLNEEFSIGITSDFKVNEI